MNEPECDLERLMRHAATLAGKLRVGDVVLLYGDLGAGKTTFVKLLAQSLSSDVEVTSPTFNLVHVYNVNKFDIWHFDLYRVQEPTDVFCLGIEEAFANGVSIIEWPQIAESYLPERVIRVNLGFGSNQETRSISISHSKPMS